MKKLLLTLLLCSILLITVVSAAPPFQTSTATSGLDIKYPQIETVKQNTSISYHTHVYNASTGLLVTNATTTCFAHLYNSVGEHVLQRDLEWDSNNIDFKLDIDAGNFTTLQRMSAIVTCNSSTEGGFVSFGFDVTTNGKASPEGIVKVIFFAFFLILLFGVLFSFLKILGHWKNLEVDILDLATTIGIYLVIFAFQYLAINYLGDPVINDLMGLMVIVGAITHVFVPLAAFAASLILNPFRKGTE